ncbi:MAG: hypothetical protein Q4C91_23505 [Eubacteriales bacterium]|nr:hypothetical protein [Eubacteriales bacterium]
MKRLTAIGLSVLLVLSLAACGNSNQNTVENTPEAGSGNILIAYFSVMETDGVDNVAGASCVAVDGEVLDCYRNFLVMAEEKN